MEKDERGSTQSETVEVARYESQRAAEILEKVKNEDGRQRSEEEASEQVETVESEAVREDSRAAELIDGFKGQQTRTATLIDAEIADVNQKERTVKLTFASEYPVFRRDLNANEVLQMSDGAANLKRLNAGGALLSEHNRADQIGGVMKAWIGPDKRAHAVVKFSRSERGNSFLQDVVDGLRRNVSFHYAIHDGKVTAGQRGNPDTFTATSWEATEISFVSVPADPTIGVGRSEEQAGDEPESVPETVEAQRSEEVTPIEPEAEHAPATITQHKRGSEMEREDQILEFGRKFGAEEMARSFALDPNKNLEDFRRALLEVEAAKQQKQVVETQPTNLDLNKRDVKEYSITRAIRQIVQGKREGFEFECSNEIAKRMGRDAMSMNSILVPLDIQSRGYRDLSVGLGSQPGDGGALVATEHLAGSFIDLLRSKMVMMQLGVQMLSGLVGNINIPRQDSAATGYWVAEGVAPTESQLEVGQLTLSPKTVGAVTEYTRLLYLQSAPSIDQLVFSDLAAVIARSIDLAIIKGGGSGEPTGILTTSGVVDGTVGAANGASFDWGDAVNMETVIESANAPAGRAYLTTPAVRGALKTRAKIGSTYPVFLCENNEMNGYPVVTSTQVPSAAGIFGDYSQIIVGEWGVLELVANPFSTGFRAGNVEVRGLQTVDVAIRYPQALTKFEAFT